MTSPQNQKDYRFVKALRPFSFAVAIIACSTGLTVAWLDGANDPARLILILLGGVLLQAGVNLINDFSDLNLPGVGREQSELIKRNFNQGLLCFLGAASIGIWLVFQVGLSFLFLCLIGLVGALGYTLNPINYKSKGLGVVLVFWLMGILMIVGSYLAATGSMRWDLVLFALPISVLVSLLLLSNELRDFHDDKQSGIETLTVRIGYERAVFLFKLMFLLVFIAQVFVSWNYDSWWLLIPLVALIFLPRLLEILQVAPDKRELPPFTGRLLMVFGVLLNLSLALTFSH